MFFVRDREQIRVAKDTRRPLKANLVFAKVAPRFLGIPIKIVLHCDNSNKPSKNPQCSPCLYGEFIFLAQSQARIEGGDAFINRVRRRIEHQACADDVAVKSAVAIRKAQLHQSRHRLRRRLI